jgi:hypothetical protein
MAAAVPQAAGLPADRFMSRPVKIGRPPVK